MANGSVDTAVIRLSVTTTLAFSIRASFTPSKTLTFVNRIGPEASWATAIFAPVMSPKMSAAAAMIVENFNFCFMVNFLCFVVSGVGCRAYDLQ